MPKEYKPLFGSADIRSIEQELLDMNRLMKMITLLTTSHTV